MVELSVLDASGAILASAKGERECHLAYLAPYMPGDRVVLHLSSPRARVKLDAFIDAASVYIPTLAMTWRVPFGDERLAYAPGAFGGDRHILGAQLDEADPTAYRNLALNPADVRGASTAFPHATANVETRNEAVFAARNVLDGVKTSAGHGPWPFQSWGIGTREDAELTVDFGRAVCVDKARVTLRADFPHDAYWTRGVLALSDGAQIELTFQMTGEAQAFMLGAHTIERATLRQLVKCDMPSAFPALKQLELFGRDLAE